MGNEILDPTHQHRSTHVQISYYIIIGPQRNHTAPGPKWGSQLVLVVGWMLSRWLAVASFDLSRKRRNTTTDDGGCGGKVFSRNHVTPLWGRTRSSLAGNRTTTTVMCFSFGRDNGKT